jgi:hypothetical protein
MHRGGSVRDAGEGPLGKVRKLLWPLAFVVLAATLASVAYILLKGNIQ